MLYTGHLIVVYLNGEQRHKTMNNIIRKKKKQYHTTPPFFKPLYVVNSCLSQYFVCTCTKQSMPRLLGGTTTDQRTLPAPAWGFWRREITAASYLPVPGLRLKRMRVDPKPLNRLTPFGLNKKPFEGLKHVSKKELAGAEKYLLYIFGSYLQTSFLFHWDFPSVSMLPTQQSAHAFNKCVGRAVMKIRRKRLEESHAGYKNTFYSNIILFFIISLNVANAMLMLLLTMLLLFFFLFHIGVTKIWNINFCGSVEDWHV